MRQAQRDITESETGSQIEITEIGPGSEKEKERSQRVRQALKDIIMSGTGSERELRESDTISSVTSPAVSDTPLLRPVPLVVSSGRFLCRFLSSFLLSLSLAVRIQELSNSSGREQNVLHLRHYTLNTYLHNPFTLCFLSS